jgi:hypothetical protein
VSKNINPESVFSRRGLLGAGIAAVGAISTPAPSQAPALKAAEGA